MDPSKNPYSPGAGARLPALVGREEELPQFEIALRRLGNGYSDRSFMLSGLRGVGKTVLLNEFCGIAHRHKGLCHAPRHGEMAFAAPMFDQFVQRRVSSS